ncbi:rhamnogalacturonan acetylesterase [Formosa haliotis]|uniref:rhamnogalacturonan acetylesterase n=1 Tax=Formosa haliotis TaxID=1555194 RepID=UPI0009F4EC53|nr:rhamnogalacturonan acetylesterase [Formosa haliotis]
MKPILFLLIHFITSCIIGQRQTDSYSFYFGKESNDKTAIQIANPITYSKQTGYGFDFNSAENVSLKNKALTGTGSIYFSVKLPEGNYKIDLILGEKKASNTTVKAESRRLMLPEIKVNKNHTVHKSFIVNVRTPKINDSSSISIKDRENNYLNWDDKLTLEFLGNSAIQSLKITPITKIKTLFLAGDSTVTDQDVEPWGSWGQFITAFFNTNVVVANYANSGASLSSFKGRKRLDKILSKMRPGDYLFIEFGHNDEKIKGEGNGAWGLYSNLLKEFVLKARDKGGIPVLLTPTQRRAFNKNNTLNPTHGDFPDAMRKVASDLQVPLIDLTKMTTELYEAWGDQNSRLAFVQYPANTFPGQDKALDDNTHFNSFGANEVAKCVLLGIQNLNLDLVKYFNNGISEYTPKQPDQLKDWTVPMSSRFEINKPDGN